MLNLIKLIPILVLLMLSACTPNYTPQQVKMARNYCKANDMEYYVMTTEWTDRHGQHSTTLSPKCKDVDGVLYYIPEEAVTTSKIIVGK